MKRTWLEKEVAAVICAVGLCVFSGLASAQENVALPLDEAGAEAIALADAGVEEADVARLRTVHEREDGEDVTEVEFSYGDNSYEYVLRESDGMILEWSVEGRAVSEAAAELTLTDGDAVLGGETSADTQTEQISDTQTDVGSSDGTAVGDEPQDGSTVVRITVDGTELIGYEEATRIALEDSGIAEADAELAKLAFEYDGRFYDYELELRAGRAEYEYKIDAQTGEIVEVEKD